MDNQGMNPTPDRDYITGSERNDRRAGILIGIAWWVVGGFLTGLSKGGLFPFIFIAFLGHLFYVGSRSQDRTMLLAIILTASLVPVVVFLGLFGMCALNGFKIG